MNKLYILVCGGRHFIDFPLLCDILDNVIGDTKEVEKVALLRPTLCDPMDCTVHGILQAKILEWVAFSRGFSQPSDQTQVSGIAGRYFTS